jgi:carboxyl-terminal processing protease
MRRLLPIFFPICLIVFISCNPQKKYIIDALDIIQKHSIKKEKIDWNDYRSKVLKYGKKDKTMDDYHKTIKYALSLLNDGHSLFVSSTDLKKGLSDTTMKKIKSIVSEYTNGIGYIKIPGFFGNEKLEKIFAGRIQDLIKDLDKHKIIGWIIDLRDNEGGNMWPMLLGVGPILGDGTAGYFVNDKNVFEKWGYSKGKAFMDTTIVLQADSIYQLKNKNKKIAILVNNKTASAAEAIAVAFIGLPNTRFFGNPTYGRTTGNSEFILSDSSMIELMTVVYADRNKTLYGKRLIPDEIAKDDDPKYLAIKWINWTMLN